ncbi:MAG TPA: NifB/NifX family molybdenum-iron cluster-binding protein [Candidatus Krumholzibacterium sp.]|nr:NifB/NifX family molybdenum-iron cluster-binding protein [Candidatus Krumholzibacterium sp.]
MVIAVSSTGTTEEGPVDRRFGRAPYFILYDTDTGKYRTVDNSRASGETQGAGITAGETLFKQSVDTVITFHVGPKAFRVLEAGRIDVAVCREDMTVKEAVGMFLSGKLESLDGPDVEGHWT